MSDASYATETFCISAIKQLLVVDQTTKHYLEKYKNAKSSGWMKSKDGSWIRDPNAEFDSDDEAPDI